MNPKLTLNYGLRLDVINPQTVNEAGNGTWVDLVDRPRPRGRRRRHRSRQATSRTRLNWAPRLGAAYQLNEKTVIRGGLRPQLRHRRVRLAVRPHRHAEPARAGRSEPEQSRTSLPRCSTLAQGPPNPSSVDGRLRRHIPVAQWRHAARVAAQAAPAGGGCLERHGPAAVERARCRSRSPTSAITARHVFAEDNPAENVNQAAIEGFIDGPVDQPAPAVLCRWRPAERPRHRRQLRLDAERGWLLQRGAELVQVAAGQVHAAVLRRVVGAAQLHAAEGQNRTTSTGSTTPI